MLVTGKAYYLLLWERLISTAVSASDYIRDNLREIVRTYLDESVSLLELEYQP